MHELGVVFHIMDSLETVAAQNEVKGITKVVLELGEVSTVLEPYLQKCYLLRRLRADLFHRGVRKNLSPLSKSRYLALTGE